MLQFKQLKYLAFIFLFINYMKINLHNPPNEVINNLINLYNQKNMLAVIKQAKLNVEKYPNAFLIWNILGAALADTLGMLDKSIEAYKKCLFCFNFSK